MVALSRPSIRRKDMDAVLSCMVSDRLGPGSVSDDLLRAVSSYLGLAGGIALRERTRAFAVALSRLELDRGAAVILDPLIPRAYHEVVTSLGLRPLYVDTVSGGATIDPAQVERHAGEAAALVASSHLGFCPDLARLSATSLPIIEDITHGIGAHTGEGRAGSYGRLVLFAMEPESVVTAGGGTLLLAPQKKGRAALRRVAAALQSDVLLQDMNAALGTIQVKEIESYIARRSEIAGVYQKALMQGRHSAMSQSGDGENVWFTFPVLVRGSAADVATYAKSKGVECKPAFAESVLAYYGTGTEQNDSERPGSSGEAADPEQSPPSIAVSEFPSANEMVLRCIRFPLFPSLTTKEVQLVQRVLVSLP